MNIDETQVVGGNTEDVVVNEQQEENSQSVDATTNQEEGKQEVNEVTFDDKKEKKPQSKEQNSKFARERRERELKEKIFDSEMKATFRALGGINPFSQEPMKDKADYEEYLNMLEMKEKGLDPMVDYSKYQKEKERQRQLELQEQEELNQKAQAELNGFREKNPDVNISELLNDDGFVSILRGKDGNISEAYDLYQKMQTKFQEKANQIAAQALANANASLGSANGKSGGNDTKFFTREQVESMSKSEIRQHLKEIEDSQKKW